jgi:hypothetical protein
MTGKRTNVFDVAEQRECARDTQRRSVMLPNLQVSIAQEKEIHALRRQVGGILEPAQMSGFIQARFALPNSATANTAGEVLPGRTDPLVAR